MIRRLNRRPVAAALLGCAVLFAGMTGCTPASSAESSILSGDLPANVTAKNVLVAAVLLSTSDIDGAVAEGLVTPAEVDAAAAAIKNGTLDLWRQRAEADR